MHRRRNIDPNKKLLRIGSQRTQNAPNFIYVKNRIPWDRTSRARDCDQKAFFLSHYQHFNHSRVWRTSIEEMLLAKQMFIFSRRFRIFAHEIPSSQRVDMHELQSADAVRKMLERERFANELIKLLLQM